MAGASDLFDLQVDLLETAQLALAATAGGQLPPAVVYPSPGVPALDCVPLMTTHQGGPQIATSEAGGSPMADYDRVPRLPALIVVPIILTYATCIPTIEETGERPDPARVAAAALEHSEGVWAIWNGVRRRVQDQSLFGGRCGHVAVDPMTPPTPQGGAAVSTLTVRAGLDGWDPFGEAI